MTVKKTASEAPYRCSFYGCLKRFVRQRHMHMHKEKKHSGFAITAGAHRCNICGRGFSQKKQLRRHTMQRHKNLHSEFTVHYSCADCEVETMTVTKMKLHKQTKHNMIRIYFCALRPVKQQLSGGFSGAPQCVFVTRDIKSVKRHVQTHAREQSLLPMVIIQNKHACNQCSFVIDRPEHLTRHQKTRCLTIQAYKSDPAQNSFECTHCGGIFKQANSYRVHLKEVCPSLSAMDIMERKVVVKKSMKQALSEKKQLLGFPQKKL